MRNWGVIVTSFYFLILWLLLYPGFLFLGGSVRNPFSALLWWPALIPILALVSGQALLLFLSVDTSHKRLKPSAHIYITVALTSALLAVLVCTAIFSVAAAAKGDVSSGAGNIILFESFFLSWSFWGIIFLIVFRDANQVVTRATSWLLKGSVLELIIAVVCHVIVRRRHDCSAPIVTSFGIVTGIAIMLFSFGPSVFFLLKKRMDERAPWLTQ